MPLVQYRNPSLGVDVSKKMFTPKKIQSLGHWLREARKVIRDIPKPDDRGWEITAEGASVELVSFELRHRVTGEFAYVRIDRTIRSFG